MKITRFTATDVKSLLSRLPSPVSWRDLVQASTAEHPKEIRQLRQMLKGLERNGELARDLQGNYFDPGAKAQSLKQGVVVQSGRGLRVDGYDIERGRMPLRAGDKVNYAVEGEGVEVLDILEFSPSPVVGTLNWQGRYPYVEAMGLTRGRVGLIDPPAMGDHGDTVKVKIVGRDRRGLMGVVVDSIEGESVLDEAIQTALVTHQIPAEWPDEVTKAASKLPKSVQPSRFPQRQDLQTMPLVTIDGITAKDFDDAVYAERRRGGFRLVVAIADVAHYVKMGSALDLEALNRGTSVYFPQRVVPMLPEVLSNGLCSLRPQTPRLALVCDMNVSQKGKVTRHRFYEAVIYSHARLTYEQVQDVLDGGRLPEKDVHEPKRVAQSIKALSEVFAAFTQARERRGALDFPTREGALHIDGGRVTGISEIQRVDAHRLIEEAMIAANVSAATFLEESGLGGLYRVHEPPDQGKVEELRQALAVAGVVLPKGDVSSAAVQSALARLPAHANRWLYAQLALRAMQQAIYTPNNQGHFGLALDRYMHFTSPIRRYPDLVVHRLIKAQLAQDRDDKPPRVPNEDDLVWLGEQTSNFERRAESAGWMVEGWLKCDYLMDFKDQPLQGVIAAVMDFGLFVELEGYFVQGLVHVSNLGSDYFQFNARTQSLVGESSGKRFRMGDPLEVVIRYIEPAQGKIDLEIVGNAGRKSGRRGEKDGGGRSSRRGDDGRSAGKRAEGAGRKKGRRKRR